MKELVSMICCVLCMRSISQPPIDAEANAQKASGEKVLIKALAVIVNPESNKKVPGKTVNIYSSECPL